MTSDIERRLLDTSEPDPPRGLRDRVLAAAHPLVQPHNSRLDAIWFSPRWRVAAVLLFVGLVAADGLSSGIDGFPAQRDGPSARSSVAVATQAAIDAGLGQADVAAIAAQASLRPWTTEVDVTGGPGMGLTGVPR